jgi:hypothetical protein
MYYVVVIIILLLFIIILLLLFIIILIFCLVYSKYKKVIKRNPKLKFRKPLFSLSTENNQALHSEYQTSFKWYGICPSLN